jgi:photosystem II protein PsbQ
LEYFTTFNIMPLLRPLISLLLVCVAVLLVSCSGPEVKAPTYSDAQLAKIQLASKGVNTLENRLSELADLIDQKDWNNVRSFIHGPLGELRTRMVGVARELLPAQRQQALEVGKEIFVHLNKIDAAAADNNQQLAASNYSEALKDFAAFDKLLPELPKAVDTAEAAT